MSEARYPAQVFWSEEDEGFIALALDLPGCSAFGETEAEALAELKDAISAWILAAREAGKDVPRPSNPRADDKFNGKVMLRMPKDLHRDLAAYAEQQGVSLNQSMNYLLSHGLRPVETAQSYGKVVHSSTWGLGRAVALTYGGQVIQAVSEHTTIDGRMAHAVLSNWTDSKAVRHG